MVPDFFIPIFYFLLLTLLTVSLSINSSLLTSDFGTLYTVYRYTILFIHLDNI